MYSWHKPPTQKDSKKGRKGEREEQTVCGNAHERCAPSELQTSMGDAEGFGGEGGGSEEAERNGEERISGRRGPDGVREANKLCLTRGTTS